MRSFIRILFFTGAVTVFVFFSEQGSVAANTNLPAGSLILRGVPELTKQVEVTVSPAPILSTNSPEHWLGLHIQSEMRISGQDAIAEAFDLNGLFHRIVPGMPVSRDTKQKLLNLQTNTAWRQAIFKAAIGDLAGTKVQFLGTRPYRSNSELLFRGIPNAVDAPRYVGFVTQRQSNGVVRLVDAHLFQRGELLSEGLRREMLQDAARKKLISGPVNARDQVFLSSSDALNLFESRCDYGLFEPVQAAYEQLPEELQSDRHVLFRFATSGEQTLKDILKPVELWRKNDPDDPTPNLLLVNFYWRLYQGSKQWATPQEKDDVTAAVLRANAWFADPMMETRLAQSFASEPARARPLLQQAIQRVPADPEAFSEMLKWDLASRNFSGVAEMLHLKEQACQTNLTAMVNESPDYTAFRNSFQWKKWQHDYHGVDIKSLVETSLR